MATVAIRNMDEETWAEAKAKAAKNNMKISEYIETLVKKDVSKTNWEEILLGEKVLTEEDAKIIEKASKEIRKNFRMRDFDWD